MPSYQGTVLVVTELSGQHGGGTEPCGGDRDVQGRPTRMLAAGSVWAQDHVDECLTDDQEGTRHVSSQLSKFTDEYARSFDSWWCEVISRIVPLRERITSEWVVHPPAR